MLLVLSHRSLAGHHLHFHSARQKEFLLGRTARSVLVVLALDGVRLRLLMARHAVDQGLASRLSLVVVIQLLDVQAVAPLLQVRVRGRRVHRLLHRNRRSTVALLRVHFSAVASVHRLDEHAGILGCIVHVDGSVGRRNDCLASGVETEVGLVHQLVVEGGVRRVVVRY